MDEAKYCECSECTSHRKNEKWICDKCGREELDVDEDMEADYLDN